VNLTALMAHPRMLIRQAVRDLLEDANTAAGARVTTTRVDPHQKGSLPAIGVYTLNDHVTPESATTAPVELTHELELEISAWVEHTQAVSVDDAMDNIAEQIENAMDIDPYLRNTAGDSILDSTLMEVVEIDGRSSPLVGIVVLTYTVTYRNERVVPAQTDDFLRADVKQTPVGGVGDTPAVEDLITVRTP
jgi:hypothetical protein